jgi:hypothetical protein
MKQNQKRNRPSFSAFVVEGEGDKAFWTRIGSAWPHEDGEGYTLNLAALPVNGRIVLRTPNAGGDQEAAR